MQSGIGKTVENDDSGVSGYAIDTIVIVIVVAILLIFFF